MVRLKLAACEIRGFHHGLLAAIPPVFISPGAYLTVGMVAFYHQSSRSIYFRDTYLNVATPQQLSTIMIGELLNAWIHQHIFNSSQQYIPPDNPMWVGALEAAKRLLGIYVQPILPSPSTLPALPAPGATHYAIHQKPYR
jgi:hypothetical protein